MRKVNRSALVPYSAAQMFALVKDVEAYPAFLPWCNDAEVHIRAEDFIEASLELQHGKKVARGLALLAVALAGEECTQVLQPQSYPGKTTVDLLCMFDPHGTLGDRSQHRQLVDLMNRLIDIKQNDQSGEGVVEALGEMTNYLGDHFDTEEQMMIEQPAR